MPNWVDTRWNVTLPTNKVQRFLNYFLTSDDTDKLRGRYLFRTFIVQDSIHVVETVPGFSALSFVSDSAWSLESILTEHIPSDDSCTKCVSLDWVCQDCEVEELEAIGDEPGMCFRQRLGYTKDMGYIDLQAEDLTCWCCSNCHTFGYWEDQDPDVDNTICPECGEKLYEEEDEDETSESV